MPTTYSSYPIPHFVKQTGLLSCGWVGGGRVGEGGAWRQHLSENITSPLCLWLIVNSTDISHLLLSLHNPPSFRGAVCMYIRALTRLSKTQKPCFEMTLYVRISAWLDERFHELKVLRTIGHKEAFAIFQQQLFPVISIIYS